MRLRLLAAAVWFPLLVIGRSLRLSPRPLAVANVTSRPLPVSPSFSFHALPVLVAGKSPKTVSKQALNSWEDYVCRGEELLEACISNKDKAVQFLTPIDSPFDTTFDADLKRWGYNERDADADCMFDTYLKTPFEAMGIDPRGDVEGGPNQCFRFQHWDPDARDEEGYQLAVVKQTYELNGIEYRVNRSCVFSGYQLIATAGYTGQSHYRRKCRRWRHLSPRCRLCRRRRKESMGRR
jgi:hypothetical protein